MISTPDAPEYEKFSYENYDREPLTLEGAMRQAEILRRKDTKNFYRIIPADEDMTRFYIETKSPADLYASFLQRLGAFVAKSRK